MINPLLSKCASHKRYLTNIILNLCHASEQKYHKRKTRYLHNGVLEGYKSEYCDVLVLCWSSFAGNATAQHRCNVLHYLEISMLMYSPPDVNPKEKATVVKMKMLYIMQILIMTVWELLSELNLSLKQKCASAIGYSQISPLIQCR